MHGLMTIKELLGAKEGEHIQFEEAKSSFPFEDASKCCCALSNCGGGLLVLGITDQRPRSVVGSNAFQQPERTRMRFIEKLHIQIDFQILEDHGKRVLIFDVSGRPLGLPVQYEGVAWWYEGDSLIPMPENVRRRIYDESGFDFSASICTSAKISDLDESALNVFREKWAEKSNNFRIMNLTKEQLLHDCGAITDDGVTYAALIMFGKREALRKYLPQAEIVFEYRSGNSAGPASQREEFQVGFFSCFDRLWELINLRNDKQHYQEGFFVFDIPTFNEQTVREAILNAVSHRNFQMGGSIFIRQYRDRLVVESPGGLPNGITLDNILNRQSTRNRRIAEILSLCGLVECSGQGMNLMVKMSIREAKELPDFTGTDDYGVTLTLHGMVLDKNMPAVFNKIGNERMESFSTEDFLIVNDLYHGGTVSQKLNPSLKRLTDLGIVEHVGRNQYALAGELNSTMGKQDVHTRLVGQDRDTNKELLLKHIQESGTNGVPFKELQQLLPGLSRGQIRVLLNQLRDDKRIYCDGKTSAAKWYATVKEKMEES